MFVFPLRLLVQVLLTASIQSFPQCFIAEAGHLARKDHKNHQGMCSRDLKGVQAITTHRPVNYLSPIFYFAFVSGSKSAFNAAKWKTFSHLQSATV